MLYINNCLDNNNNKNYHSFISNELATNSNATSFSSFSDNNSINKDYFKTDLRITTTNNRFVKKTVSSNSKFIKPKKTYPVKRSISKL